MNRTKLGESSLIVTLRLRTTGNAEDGCHLRRVYVSYLLENQALHSLNTNKSIDQRYLNSLFYNNKMTTRMINDKTV